MIALRVEGLRWCQHAGWLLVLLEAYGPRQLQVTLPLPDALALGHELAGRGSERTGLYSLIGGLLHAAPRPASVQLALGDAGRARVALVVETEAGEQRLQASTADAVALAVRASLPLLADEKLMAEFSIEKGTHAATESPPRASPGCAPGVAEIPAAFRLALEEPS